MADDSEARTRYERLIEDIFLSKYENGAEVVDFEREDIERSAAKLKVKLPRNLGDVIYTFRFRGQLPDSIRRTAPEGKEWRIQLAGRARYRFIATAPMEIVPNELLAVVKVPDATPGVIAMYALTDEQALLAKLRYNRLLDIFTGVTCYSLQSHLRTTVTGIGQLETDEIYVGVDRSGAHYVFPVQAKGGRDRLGIGQIEQDYAMCQDKFPNLICVPIAAQFMVPDLIALFSFSADERGLAISAEKHYRLVSPDDMSDDDLNTYRAEAVRLQSP